TQGGGGEGGPPESPGEKAGYSAPPVKQSTTKIDVPTFDLPIAVQTVPEQVIVDQNAIKIEDALQNVSGVRSIKNNIEGYVFNIRRFQTTNVFHDGITILESVPAMIRAMLDGSVPTLPLKRLRWLLPTGEALPPDLLSQLVCALPRHSNSECVRSRRMRR